MEGSADVVAGRYRLAEILGRGGMGSVWRATDEVLSRQVAVKLVERPRGAAVGDDLLARGIREARAAARLNHPNAVTVHDVVETEDRCAIVMELVEAPTLADVVKADGPLPVARVAGIGRQLVDVLDAAHGQGIVHRDVKPSNVLLLPGDRVKLTDFGIASLQGDPTLTRPGMTMGSPRFMAPEQATGGLVGPPADWWALAATLYFAAEGRPPFAGATAQEVVAAILAAPPQPVVLAGALAPLLTATLVREPADRPDAEGLRALLDLATTDPGVADETVGPQHPQHPQPGDVMTLPAAAPGPASPDPVTPTMPAARTRGRRDAIAILAAAASVVVFVVVVVSIARWQGWDYPWQEDGPAAREAGTGSLEPAAAEGPTASAGAGEATTTTTPAATQETDEPVDELDGLAAGPLGRSGLVELESSQTAAPGQVLPGFTVSVTNTEGGYAIAVPSLWTVTADGTSTFADWNDTMFQSAFEVRSGPAEDPWPLVQRLETAFAAAHAADGYERVSLTDRWTYAGREAASWEFTWLRNGEDTHAQVVAFEAEGRTYTVLYRSKALWWLSGGSAAFPADFERGFTPLP